MKYIIDENINFLIFRNKNLAKKTSKIKEKKN